MFSLCDFEFNYIFVMSYMSVCSFDFCKYWMEINYFPRKSANNYCIRVIEIVFHQEWLEK